VRRAGVADRHRKPLRRIKGIYEQARISDHRIATRINDPASARSDEIESSLRVMPAQRHPAAYAAGTPSSRASTSFLRRLSKQDVDGRDKPGHDSGKWFNMIGTRAQSAPASQLDEYWMNCL